MTGPIPSARFCRALAAVERERASNVIPFPPNRMPIPAPDGGLRSSAPAVEALATKPPRQNKTAGAGHPSIPPRDFNPVTLQDVPSHAATKPEHALHCPPQDHPRSNARSGYSSSLAPHVAPFQRRQPDVSVLIETPPPAPLDPAKREAIAWAMRHRDGWDSVGIAVAIAGLVMIASRCLPSIFPSLFY